MHKVASEECFSTGVTRDWSFKMANPAHVDLVRQLGARAINDWPIEEMGMRLDLTDADLRGLDLSGANCGMTFKTDRWFAEANGTKHGVGRVTASVTLLNADLRDACLASASFQNTMLTGVDFRGADLHGTNFTGSHVANAKFQQAHAWGTLWCNLDLRQAVGLEEVQHGAPSEIGMQTLVRSLGAIPEKFLRGCGLSVWHTKLQRLFDPTLSANSVSNLLIEEIFPARTDGPLFLGGSFVSYSHKDAPFVDKLDASLSSLGVPVWRDVRNLVAGPLESQIFEAIRLQDAVIVVLSENSITSDWVEAEIDQARKREKSENRTILCPVALDDAWQSKAASSVLWRTLTEKNILDFSSWRTKAYTAVFDRLVAGLKRFYSPVGIS